jgi:protocatechuate 3,4-dioxygenase beta subunit
MKTLRSVACLLALVLVSALCAQDVEWVRDWEDAQRTRPAQIQSISRIAPVKEPGTPLIVHGRVVQRDGVTPAPGVIVFAYQTDATGVYNARGTRGWRLRGWVKSDAQGRFEFRTIRPGSYPGSRNPAHIHITIEGPGLPRRWAEEVNFRDDPFVNANAKTALPVNTQAGVQHVNYTIRIADTGTF